jgi:PAS domain S-box-containing protein
VIVEKIMNRPLRVLLVDDSEDDTFVIVDKLRENGYHPFFERVDTVDALQSALSNSWDLIIAEYELLAFSAAEALNMVKHSQFDIPFLVVTDIVDREDITAIMLAGAKDCILKDNLSRLIPVVERELSEVEERRERKRADRAHQESEQRFRKIFAANPLPMVIVRMTDYRLLNSNQSFLRLTGLARDEVVGRPWNTLGFWPYNGDWSALFALLQEQTSLDGIELRLGAPESADILELQAWMELIELEGETSVLCIMNDITERRQAEERTHRQFQRMAALRRIHLSISASLDLNHMLDRLLDTITILLGIDAAAVLLLSQNSQHLEYAAGRGFHTPVIKQCCLQHGEGYAGQIVQKRRSMSIPDMRQFQDGGVRIQLQEAEGFIAYYGVPLVAKGQVKGVLEFFHRSLLIFDQEWVNFLEAIAGQAAIAIDNAELFENLQRSKDDLTRSYDATIEGWVRALDLRDKETEGHSIRVMEMTVKLARAMGMSEDELVHIRRGALLHDIGKIGIPDKILHKPAPLDAEEWAIMKRHPQFSYDMLAPIDFLRPALDIPFSHHEKWDGSGYPQGLAGEEIPLPARVFAIVDVWDALSFDRPYRKAWSQQRVRKHLRQLAGSHFDPQVVEVFLQVIDEEEARRVVRKVHSESENVHLHTRIV